MITRVNFKSHWYFLTSQGKYLNWWQSWVPKLRILGPWHTFLQRNRAQISQSSDYFSSKLHKALGRRMLGEQVKRVQDGERRGQTCAQVDRSLGPLLPVNVVCFFVLFFGGGASWPMEFPGQGSDLSCSCGNARSLTYCAVPRTEPASQHSRDTIDPFMLQWRVQLLYF